MSFKHDIFISYAHIDNETPLQGQEGWVSQFHRALEVRVGQLLGKKPAIWRDPKLQGNDLFADTLVEQLPQVALLVSVLTPRYAQSEWCQRELSEFCTASGQSGGLRVVDKARLFKVIKTPLPTERHPAQVQPLLGYEFYMRDPESGRVRELDQMFGPEAQREFWARLDDLAHDMAALLERLHDDCAEPGAGHAAVSAPQKDQAAGDKGAVFLALTTQDLRADYDAVKRELQRHGYRVLPDRQPPMLAAELLPMLQEDLARCRMSIHPVGANYGVVPEGATESLVALQHELAIERGEAGGFTRLVWIPRGLQSKDERQLVFIDRLRRDPRMQQGTDLLETPLEDLKSAIHHHLAPPKKTERAPEANRAPEPGAGEPQELTHLYLICDQRDQEAVSAVESDLFDRGYEVVLPAFEGDEADVRQDHEENLRTCDAALVYYGAGNELWLRRKLRELQKAVGLGRFRPMVAKGILVAPPSTPQKERLRTREALVLHQNGESFSPDVLEPFVSAIRAAKDAEKDVGS